MGRTVNVGILGGGKEGVGPPAGHMGRSWPSYGPPIKVVIIGVSLLCCVLGKRSLLSLFLSSPTRHDDKREREGREGTRGTASKRSWGAPLIIATPDIMPGFKSTGSEVVEGGRKKKRCKSGPTTHSPITALVPPLPKLPFCPVCATFR